MLQILDRYELLSQECMQISGVASGVSEDPFLAVSSSSLCGNTWRGSLSLVHLAGDGTVAEEFARESFSCGLTAACVFRVGERDGIIAVGDDAGDVYLYRCSASNLLRQQEGLTLVSVLSDHDDIVSCVAQTSGRIVSGSWDSTVKVWDTNRAEQEGLAPCISTYSGHLRRVVGVASLDNHSIASAAADKYLRMWDTRSREGELCGLTRLIAAAPMCLTATVCGTKVAVGCEDGQVLIYDCRQLSHPLVVTPGRGLRVGSIAFSPSGDCLGCGNDGGGLSIVRSDGPPSGLPQRIDGVHSDYIRALDWIGDQDIVTGGWDGTLVKANIHS
jgi:WD40 repeat protein